MTTLRSALIVCVLALLVSATVRADDAGSTRPMIGLWITRWDYRSPDDVRQCLSRAAELGCTDVFWQVRGAADAFYSSDLEPWGRELFRDLPPDAADPGFDPLALAVSEAHARGVKLHAWVNIMPLWKGRQPPTDRAHAFNAHPEWRLRDATGAAQPLTDHYVIVNPLLPAVQDHLVAVCKDIVTRYAVDGLHMDYIRFVSDSMADPASYPRDKPSIEVFEQHVGHVWTNSPEDHAAFRDLKRDQITQIVRRIKTEAVAARPGVQLTAAVWRRPDIGRDTYLQDGAKWLADGTLDRAFPMIYTKDDKQFADDLASWRAAAPGRPITPGIGIYLHPPGGSASQFTLADGGGEGAAANLALFAYSSMFESVDPFQEKSAARIAERANRLERIRAEIDRRLAAAPSAPVSASPDDRPLP